MDLSLDAKPLATASIVSGLSETNYNKVLKKAKIEIINSILPSIITNFKEISLPFLAKIR